MTKTQQQTLQQQRAAHAWQQVETVAQSDKEYGPLVRSLPAMIQHDGLAPTLAFLKAKDKNKQNTHHWRAYEQLSDWVKSQISFEANSDDLLECLIKNNSTTYRHATTEALAYLSWLKRFVEAKGLGDGA
ncbi:MAG: type III-B CRISPR module-associated protein Cmr5 [Anaerolineae bacterium]|nr:MAG: type III-B CRISPR module-associated protein Cmr5 [Anaerolineae bacterium]